MGFISPRNNLDTEKRRYIMVSRIEFRSPRDRKGLVRKWISDLRKEKY